MKKRLNILIINNYFPPEIGAASHLYFYLAQELANRGNELFVLTGIPRYNVSVSVYNSYKKNKKAYLENITNNFHVIRCELPYVNRKHLLRRGIEHFEIAYKLFFYGKKLLKNKQIDVSLVYSPPLTLYWTAEKIRNLTGAPYILNVQDLFPQAAIDLGALKSKLLIKFFKSLEKKAYLSADLITVHSEQNAIFVKEMIKTLNKVGQKVIIFENWINENEIIPGNKENIFSKKLGLSDKFVISFAGTLGYSQDIKVILEAAKLTKEYKDIIYLIVGDGVKKEETLRLQKKYNLNNVILHDAVPKEEYPMILHSSDVSLATLIEEVKTPVVPSKILSIMSSGTPVVAAMNLDGDAPKLINKAKCGFVVPAGDYKALAEKILELYKNPKLREELGKNGRKYIEEHLSVKKAADKYEEIFMELISRKNKIRR
ncbi:glycosyltransferase family 4 protein [Thermosipho sp. 1063]|uniref:glycosyltransferase family 4 protein n=1 Tax=Thermosipho sp. 1063 TaxID=1462747 RepID=UPI000951158F|nr:glycosyltransferase family 4 protein [Thermosipho sp. 1063]